MRNLFLLIFGLLCMSLGDAGAQISMGGNVSYVLMGEGDNTLIAYTAKAEKKFNPLWHAGIEASFGHRNYHRNYSIPLPGTGLPLFQGDFNAFSIVSLYGTFSVVRYGPFSVKLGGGYSLRKYNSTEIIYEIEYRLPPSQPLIVNENLLLNISRWDHGLNGRLGFDINLSDRLIINGEMTMHWLYGNPVTFWGGGFRIPICKD